MMKNRITLTIDPDVAQRAKQLAYRRNTSVSGLVESFLRTASTKAVPGKKTFTAKWAGRFELATSVTPDPRRDALTAKYQLAPR